MKKALYEVVLSSKITDSYSTELICSTSLEKAEEKAAKKYGDRYMIHDVHFNKEIKK